MFLSKLERRGNGLCENNENLSLRAINHLKKSLGHLDRTEILEARAVFFSEILDDDPLLVE
jgi:hypothetical protein